MRRHRSRPEQTVLGLALVAVLLPLALLLTGGAAAVGGSTGGTGWLSFGNTAEQEPLHAGDADHAVERQVSSGRAFTVDLNKVVPGIKKGQQTYPIVVNGTMYITSGDDQVFAVNAATGDVLWHYAPYNLANFKNFGIVANRGVAYCDNRIFLLTLDMTIVALDPANGNQVARVPIARAVPGAIVELRLLGDERSDLCQSPSDRRRRRLRVRRARIRDGLQHARSHAGLAESVLDDPTGKHGVAEGSPVRRRLHRLDSDDGRPDDQHALLRDGGGCARLLPVAAAGQQPALRLADRGRPGDRADEVVAAATRLEPVGLRHVAAADGLHDQGRRQDPKDRLGRDDGGRLVRLRRGDRRSDLAAREGDRQRRAPEPQAGPAGRGLPVVARRPELLAGVVRPADRATSTTRRPRRRRCSQQDTTAQAKRTALLARRRLARVSPTATSAST